MNRALLAPVHRAVDVARVVGEFRLERTATVVAVSQPSPVTASFSSLTTPFFEAQCFSRGTAERIRRLSVP